MFGTIGTTAVWTGVRCTKSEATVSQGLSRVPVVLVAVGTTDANV